MFDDKVILCGSSSYEKIFYFNPEFDSLPKQIKEELQIMCVLFTEDVGGILRLEFDETGNLNLTVESKDCLLYTSICLFLMRVCILSIKIF